jgi:hypothetical protein
MDKCKNPTDPSFYGKVMIQFRNIVRGKEKVTRMYPIRLYMTGIFSSRKPFRDPYVPPDFSPDTDLTASDDLIELLSRLQLFKE